MLLEGFLEEADLETTLKHSRIRQVRKEGKDILCTGIIAWI